MSKVKKGNKATKPAQVNSEAAQDAHQARLMSYQTKQRKDGALLSLNGERLSEADLPEVVGKLKR